MNNLTAIREITPLSAKDCFHIVDRRTTEFIYSGYARNEFELNFIAQAPGVKRMVGDSTEIIGEYDLVLITGKDLEHVWEQHKCRSPHIREITIQFSSDLFLAGLIEKKQFSAIRRMLQKAEKGLSFPMEAVLKTYRLLDELSGKQGFYAVLDFLTILYELSLFSDAARTLSSSSSAKISVHSGSRRVQKVQEYIHAHYKEEIRLNELAGLVKMTPPAFSRFFKLHTGETVMDYIIDLRLRHAARLMVDSTLSVAEICYASGFNNISNFNRIFKKKKNCSPKEFRENYRKKTVIV
jgi:AraC-like DNA-binding protein